MKKEIKKIYLEYEKETDEKKRNEFIKVFETSIDSLLPFILKNYSILDERNLAYALAQLSRKVRLEEKLASLFTDDVLIRKLIFSADAKARKNTYILFGHLGRYIFYPYLITAASAETTYFALPSLILALGNYDVNGCKDVIISVQQRISSLDEIPEKIKSEIDSAISKALDKQQPRKIIDFIGSLEAQKVLLTIPTDRRSIFLSLLNEKFNVIKEVEEGFVVKTKDFGDIFELRFFDNMLFYFDNMYNIKCDYNELLNIIVENLNEINFLRMHGCETMNFRLTLMGIKEKNRALCDLLHIMQQNFCGKYVNSPSNYALEVIIINKRNKFKVFFKLLTIRDNRFLYRKEMLPASINPATAACLCEIAKKYYQQPQKILDPFCGTSTILIEASVIYGKDVELYGVDISAEAIRKSKVNIQGVSGKFNLINQDILKYKPQNKFDVIISNMPFGVRVGSHDYNRILYRGLINALPKLLTSDGIALLYTADAKLFETELSRIKRLRINETYKFESGGLYANLYVIRKVH